MDYESIYNTLDRDDLFSPILLIWTDFFLKNLRKDLAVVEEDILIEDANESDALEGDEKILFVFIVEHGRMDQSLADVDDVLIVHVGQSTLLQQASTEDESTLV